MPNGSHSSGPSWADMSSINRHIAALERAGDAHFEPLVDVRYKLID